MRVAITGSSGLIGGALATALEHDGHEVVRVVRSAGGPGTVSWDIDRSEIDAAGLEDLDGVVHLAGEGIAERRWSTAQKHRILHSRTAGTSLLARTLAELSTPPPVLVSGSAIGIYGDRGDERLTEASAAGVGFLAEVATAWEEATTAASSAGIRVATIRTGIVLDAAGGALPKLARLAKLGLLGKLGSGRQWMSWITLTDEVAAIRLLLESGLTGPVNLTAPGAATNAEFTKTLGRVLHRPTFLPVPRFGPSVLLGAELAQALLYDGQRVEPHALSDAGFTFSHPELDGALRAVLAD